jgi:hypothetical protein
MKRKLHTLKETLEYRRVRKRIVAIGVHLLKWDLERLSLKWKSGLHDRPKKNDWKKYPISN